MPRMQPLIPPEERARREEAVRYAAAHLRIEGLQVSDDAQRILDRYVAGEITTAELIQQTLALHDPSSVCLPPHQQSDAPN